MQKKSLKGHSENNFLARIVKIYVLVNDGVLGGYKVCNTFLMCKRTYLSPVCRIVSFGELALSLAIFSMAMLIPYTLRFKYSLSIFHVCPSSAVPSTEYTCVKYSNISADNLIEVLHWQKFNGLMP